MAICAKLGASYIFTIGNRYAKQACDTHKAVGAMPYFHYESFDYFYNNLPKGAMLVAILKRQFSYTHLVLAAYNAGSHQVQKWINLFGHLPTDLFIERIPFKQTREYVKKGMVGESIYSSLEGKPLAINL